MAADRYESGRQRSETLVTEFKQIDKSQLNEATTRFRFIDQILTQCLAWDTMSVTTEESYNGDYSDYTLSLFRPVAVVEAKRSGNYFELPAGIKNLIYPLKSLCKDNPNTKKALQQVSGYCHERGIQIGIVTNGWQLIAFLANRSDSIPPLEGDALVVPSLESFSANFREAWNCLSKYGFEEKILIKRLLGDREKAIPTKLSATIFDYPGVKNRNPFQTELEIISDLVLEDVIKEKSIEKEFLAECYCKSGALSSYSLVSREILLTRYNYLFEVNDRKATLDQVASKKGLSGELVELFANSLSKRPILLIGDVGVGKSTFIDNLLLVEAPKVFERSLTFKIDLGSKAIIALDVRKAVINEVKRQLKEERKMNIEDDDFVRHCYYGELEDFRKSVRVKRLYEIDKDEAVVKEIEYLSSLIDDEVSHLKKALDYLSKNQRKQVIIFIDNCDQRSDHDQQTAFLIAQEFASDWPVIVFVCLRPETFHRTKKASGALSGYHTKAFTIPPPRIDEVISKRLSFAQRITNGEITLSKLSNKTSFSKLHDLIDAFKASLKSKRELYEFLENLSNGNVRKCIELIKKFFGSGHVNTEKILKIYEAQGFYNVPVHELLRAVIFGDNIYYSPDNSDIVNLLDVRSSDVKEHFIIPFLLGLLLDFSRNNRNQGFVPLEDVYTFLQRLGYTPDQIDSNLNFMYSKGLFETSEKGNTIETENSVLRIRITNLGAYHLTFLINSFTYIDAILVDVPIFDEEFRGKISNVERIDDRIERAQQFRRYLDSEWSKLEIKGTHFNWNQRSYELNIDIEKIQEKIANKIK